MKEKLYSWYKGLRYEEGFGPNEVIFFQQKKRQINTCAIIGVSNYFERKNSLVRMGVQGTLFFKVLPVS